jgi:hypothetical protein
MTLQQQLAGVIMKNDRRRVISRLKGKGCDLQMQRASTGWELTKANIIHEAVGFCNYGRSGIS